MKMMPGGDFNLKESHALRLFFVMSQSIILIEMYGMETALSRHSPKEKKFVHSFRE